MIKRAFAGLLCAAALCRSAVPTPKEHFGFSPGDDYKLADYSQISGYFQKLVQSSDRIRVVPYGTTALGKPMVVAFISAAENLKKLDRLPRDRPPSGTGRAVRD